MNHEIKRRISWRAEFGIVLILVAHLLLSSCQTAGRSSKSEHKDSLLELQTESNRTITLREISASNCRDCPLVIFSHGANATYDRYDAFLIPLAKHGFRIAIPNHVDSEAHPRREDYGPADWMTLRLEDYRVIAEHYDAQQLFAAGHSFGALIAQIAAGAKLLDKKAEHIIDADLRPLAALALSPPGAIPEILDASSWSSISVPTLVTTGTKDIVPKMVEHWELHLESYEATPHDLSYALIYKDMNHYMNGAYGRETLDNNPARDAAMQNLIDSSAHFLLAVKNGQPISDQQWLKRSNGIVKAIKK